MRTGHWRTRCGTLTLFLLRPHGGPVRIAQVLHEGELGGALGREGPGAMAFSLIPYLPHSAAKLRARASTPAWPDVANSPKRGGPTALQSY